jgi:hypothetical protein
VVGAAVEFFTAGVAGEGFVDGADAFDDGEASGADVVVLAFQFAAFEGEGMACVFARDTEFRAGDLPFGAVGIYFTFTAAFVGEEVSEFVFEGSPDGVFGDVFEFWVEFDEAGGPPGAASGGAHTGVPGDADFAGEFREGEGDGLLAAPCGEAGVG